MKYKQPKYVNHGGWDTQVGDVVTVGERTGVSTTKADFSNGFGYMVDVRFEDSKRVHRVVHTQVKFHRRQRGTNKPTS